MNFSTYYQLELNFLLEMGRAFARSHPDARHLVERSNNPYAERILEGFAFLTAKLHERIDASFPEVIEPMLEMTAPHLLAPVPSCTVIEFRPDLPSVRAAKTLKRGTQVGSRKLPKWPKMPQCLFSTTHDVTVVPARVEDAKWTRVSNERTQVEIELRCLEAGHAALSQIGSLEFFVSGEPQFVDSLLFALDRHCSAVRIREEGTTERGLPDAKISLSGFERQRSLLAWNQAQSLRSHRLVAEYAHFPQAFAFVRVEGLASLSPQGESLTLLFDLVGAPDFPGNVSCKTFRLNCACAINLFPCLADPLRIDALQAPAKIRVGGYGPGDAEVYDVQKATAQPEGGGESRLLRPYYAFFSGPKSDGRAPSYALRRRMSPVDGAIDTSFYLVQWDQSRPKVPRAQIVSMDLRCTNRGHPKNLGVGDVCEQPQGRPRVPFSFGNVVLPTAPRRQELGCSLQWRLAALTSLRQSSFKDAASLRGLFQLYDPDAPSQNQTSAWSMCCRAIQGVRREAQTVPVDGCALYGVKMVVSLDASEIGVGSCYILAKLINEVYASLAPLNSFVRVQAIVHSKEESTPLTWHFEPRLSAREAL